MTTCRDGLVAGVYKFPVRPACRLFAFVVGPGGTAARSHGR